VALRFPRQSVKGFVEGLASTLDREVTDAEIDYSTNWVKIRKEKEGRTVNVRPSFKSLMTALRNRNDTASLDIDSVDPEVTADEFDQVLLVRIGENKLYLYEDGKITHEWPVATGQPSYMTPTGLYEIVEKRYMPTWVNPAPTTWGASMPASIPPGYSNPLGLRALNWSAPAIRFHGTSATYSLGYNASHGCVRMANEDVIELYDLVDVGTPIVSVISGPLRPLYSSVSVDPVPVAENEAPAVDEEAAAAPEGGAQTEGKKDDGKGH
jgi:lipoprotein-anchoring transpeptidase ErfK/SrfK